MSLFHRFRRNDGGASAVEFALVVPFIAAFLFGGVQVTNYLEVHRQVSTAASSAADLVAQVQQVSDSDLGDIFAAAAAILRPHDVSGLQVAVTSLTYVSDTQGKVLWSASRLAPSPHKAGDIVTVPSGILVAGTSVIMSEVVYTYKDPMGVINLAGLGGTYNVSDTYFDRPRRTLAVGKV